MFIVFGLRKGTTSSIFSVSNSTSIGFFAAKISSCFGWTSFSSSNKMLSVFLASFNDLSLLFFFFLDFPGNPSPRAFSAIAFYF